MKVLMLAAGRSKRMKPVEDKNFLEFMGKSLIVRQLEMLKEVGLEDVVVVGGAHNLERLRAACEGVLKDVVVVEQKDLEMGMCGAVLAAKELLDGEPVLVFSSNDVVEAKAFELVKAAGEANECDSYILGKKVSEYFPGGYLEVDKDGVIGGIVEKPGEGKAPSDLVNLVVHYHKDPSKLVSYLEKAQSDHDDIYEVAMDAMIKDGVRMKVVPYEGFWQPIKFPWHVMKVWKHFFDKAEKFVSEKAEISNKAVVKGDVIIEDGVKVFEGAVINGPVYLGKDSVVANNALVRESSVGSGCVVGFSTEVARSFLGNDVWTHSNYIGDSVIGNNVSFGAGTVTGNLRLDEGVIGDTGLNKFGLVTGDNIRVGINVSFMPGVSVGSGSYIGAGIIVGEDVGVKKFVRGEVTLKVSDNRDEVGGDRGDFKKKL